MRIGSVLLCAGLAVASLAACGEPGSQVDTVATTTEGDDSVVTINSSEDGGGGAFFQVYLTWSATREQVNELLDALSNVPASVEFDPNERDISIRPGQDASAERCFPWDRPVVAVDTSPDSAPQMIEIAESFDFVWWIDGYGQPTNKPFPFPEGQSYAIECESRFLTVYFDYVLDATELAARALQAPGVLATLSIPVDPGEGPFIPDLSAYPEVADCHAPELRSMALLVEGGTPEIVDELVIELSRVDGVAGFGGRLVDPELDPYVRWDHKLSSQDGTCEGITASVSLTPEITEEAAAVVVARAVAIPGVADVHLTLVDQASFCGDSSGEESGPGCVAVDSNLVLYLGDKRIASQEAIISALCGLDGVLWLEVYGGGTSDDPYEACGPLQLSVIMEDTTDTPAAEQMAAVIRGWEGVAIVGVPTSPREDLVPPQSVVVGTLDERLCLNASESRITIPVLLERISRTDADLLAAELIDEDGVSDVVGGAIGREPGDPARCGVAGLTFRAGSELSEAEAAAIWELFSTRTDVKAVVVESVFDEMDPQGRQPGQWVVVRFATSSPPQDLGELADAVGNMAGVVDIETADWAWDDLSG